MKTAFKATNARRFSIRFVCFVGFGYERFIQPMNSTLFVKEIVNYYLPLCRVQAVQNFARVQKPESGECITPKSEKGLYEALGEAAAKATGPNFNAYCDHEFTTTNRSRTNVIGHFAVCRKCGYQP